MNDIPMPETQPPVNQKRKQYNYFVAQAETLIGLQEEVNVALNYAEEEGDPNSYKLAGNLFIAICPESGRLSFFQPMMAEDDAE